MANTSPIAWLRNAVFLIISIVLLWLVFKGVDVQETMDIVLQANFGFLVLSRSVSLVALWLRAMRWNLLIETVDESPSDLNSFKAVMVGFLANFGIPKMGEVSRCWSLQRTDNLSISKLVGTVVVERAFDVVSLFFIMGIMFLIRFAEIRDFVMEKVMLPLMEKGQSILGNPIVWVVLLVGSVFMIWWFFIRKKKEGGASSGPLQGLMDGVGSIIHLKRRGRFLAYTAAIWLIYWMNAMIDLQAMDYTQDFGYIDALFIMILGGLGMAAPSQGGIGAYHFMVTQGLIFLGLSYTHGLAFATAVHASVILMAVIVGGLCLISVLLQKRAVKNS